LSVVRQKNLFRQVDKVPRDGFCFCVPENGIYMIIISSIMVTVITIIEDFKEVFQTKGFLFSLPVQNK
jgi:hypothetical protein